MSGRCGLCDAILNPHNITGLCAECKLVARNDRLSGRPEKSREPVVLADAIAIVMAELKATVINTTKENN